MKNISAWMLTFVASSLSEPAIGAFLFKQGVTAQKHGYQEEKAHVGLDYDPQDPGGRIDDAQDKKNAESSGTENPDAPGDYGPNTASVVVWKAQSVVHPVVQGLLIFLWVAVLAFMPLALPMYDRRPLTRTETILCLSTMLVTFGGFYLFTNVVLFQSPHFEQTRVLTSVECIYFMAQVVTTIGYGDIGPAKTRGQFFVGFYCLFALFVIAMTIQSVAEHFAKVVQRYKSQFKFSSQESIEKTPRSETIHRLIAPERPSPTNFLLSMLAFALIDIVFVVFFSNYPGEQKTVLEALYMSLITLGSIGFGFFTPLTETGMAFGAFSMVIGCSAFMVVIGEFGAYVHQYNEYHRFAKAEKHEAKEAGRPSEVMATLKEVLNGSDTVTEVQFLQFVLTTKGKTSSDEVNDILKVFRQFSQISKNEKVSAADVVGGASTVVPGGRRLSALDIKTSWEDLDSWPESTR